MGVWILSMALGLLAAVGFVMGSLPDSRPGEVTGVVFPEPDPAAALTEILQADRQAQIVDYRFGGRVMFVVYFQKDFPQRIRQHGAWALFDSNSIGCTPNAPPKGLST